MSQFATKLLLLVIVGLSMSCSSARHEFKRYYGALINKNYPKAVTYLSDSCKRKLVKLRPDLGLNQSVQFAFLPNFKSYEIGQVQQSGDSLLVAIKVTTTDGVVHIFDKDWTAETVSGGNWENGKKMVVDFRYRLYKTDGQWKVDTPYCRNFR